MSTPLSGQPLVVEPGDLPQPHRTRYPGHVFPLLVSLHDLDRHAGHFPVYSAVLVDLPHARESIVLSVSQARHRRHWRRPDADEEATAAAASLTSGDMRSTTTSSSP